jgi:hypothetical protein
MKCCPSCQRTYDDSKNFCAVDATPLLGAAVFHNPQMMMPALVHPPSPNALPSNFRAPANSRKMANPLDGYLLAARITLGIAIPLVLASIAISVYAHVKRGGLGRPGNSLGLTGILIGVLGVVLLITAVYGWLHFRKLARDVDEMFSSQHLLAHWVYPPDPSNMQMGGEAYISPIGAVLNGKYHGWRAPWGTLVSVASESGNPGSLRFTYYFGVTVQRVPRSVQVPVPRGREAEAQQIATFFSK